MRKNILILGHGFAPQFIDINNQYTRLFDQRDCEVTVVYLSGKEDETVRQKHLADQVIFLNASKHTLRGLKINLIRKILHLTRQKEFKIIIAHRYKPTYIALWVARFYSIPLIVGVMHELNVLARLFRRLTVKFLAKTNFVLAGVSNAIRDNLRLAQVIPSDCVITLYNSIDIVSTERRLFSKNTARAQLGLPLDVFVFGNIGRLVKNKDQKTLLQAYANIVSQCQRSRLIILGSGVLEQELKQLAQSLGIEKQVIFSGFVHEANRLMRAFDVLVSSSTQEAFGMGILEAMTAKVPVIATRVNGVPEVIHQSGVLVNPRRPLQLAQEMMKAYQLEGTQLATWGEKGYERACHYFSTSHFKNTFWHLLLLKLDKNLK